MHRAPALSAGIIDIINTLFSTKNEDSEVPKSYPYTDKEVDFEMLDEEVSAAANRHIIKDRRDENGKLLLNQEEVAALYEMVKIFWV